MIEVNNIFTTPVRLNTKKEIFKEILKTDNVLVEKIISSGQYTPKGKWINQSFDEWVVLLQGVAVIAFEKQIVTLRAGDYIFIPAEMKHRIEETSKKPPCVWLAIQISKCKK